MPSGVMGNFIKEMPGALKLPIGLPVQGAVPLIYNGERVGGVGASGVKAEEDEQVAAAGAKAL
jgi:glc operon protein GlcG